MSGSNHINLVIAQAHLIPKMQGLRKEQLQMKEQLAAQLELERKMKKKSQVESPNADNRIAAGRDAARQTENGGTKESRTDSGSDDEKAAPVDSGPAGSRIDIKV